ncbi:MAG: hypothetical protein Q9M18_06330 [Mariprofundaceae bacterium]|nr:hypothetical protein [Mariprofundaceae bacterium]
MKKTLLLTGFLLLTASPAISNAHEHAMENMPNMAHHDHTAMDMSHHTDMATKPGVFFVKKEIDGYTVTFHVMVAKEGMKQGGSHHLMIRIEQDGAIIKDAVINSKVFLPNKKTDSKMLMKMGDWYMAAYNLNDKGKNGIMILFKTADGKKHKAMVNYSAMK